MAGRGKLRTQTLSRHDVAIYRPVLLNTSQKVQEAVGGYFKDPTGTAKLSGSSMPSSEENFVLSKNNMEDLKDQLQKAIREIPKFDELKNHIDMTVTNEGLRIELTESAAGTFFDSGSAKISSDGADLLRVLAHELGKLPNKMAMEGHTDSSPTVPGRVMAIGSSPRTEPTRRGD